MTTKLYDTGCFQSTCTLISHRSLGWERTKVVQLLMCEDVPHSVPSAVHLGPPMTFTPPSVTDLHLPEAGPSRSQTFPRWSLPPSDTFPLPPPRPTGYSLDVPSSSRHPHRQRLTSQSSQPPQRKSSLSSSPDTPGVDAMELHDMLDKAVDENNDEPKRETARQAEKRQDNAMLDLPPPLPCHLRVENLSVGVPHHMKAKS